MRRSCVAFAAGLLLATTGLSDDWPQFRGPGGNGLPSEASVPSTWSADKNVAWKVALHGTGWSCPIAVGDKVYVTTAVSPGQPKPTGGFGGQKGGGVGGSPKGGGGFGQKGGGKAPDAVYKYMLICLDAKTGKTVWEKVALEAKPRQPTHGSNTFASETPVSDGERVFAYFGNAGLFCYDLAGTLVWKKDLGAYPMMMGWGTSSSPVLHGGRVFVQCDNEEKSFLVALDARTGEEAWRVDRDEKSGWATPYLWRTKARTDLVAAGSGKVRGYDPATGKVVWELAIGGGQCSASPVGDEERLYVGTGGMGGGMGGRPGGPGGGQPPGGGRPGFGRPQGPGAGGLFAVKAGAAGDISLKEGQTSGPGVAWFVPKAGPVMASPLAYRGFLYVPDRSGRLSCYEAATGKVVYAGEAVPGARPFWASPWGHDGKVFCLDQDGVTHVVKAGPEFEVLGKNALGRDLYWSTPAASGGALFVRGVETLYCIRQ